MQVVYVQNVPIKVQTICIQTLIVGIPPPQNKQIFVPYESSTLQQDLTLLLSLEWTTGNKCSSHTSTIQPQPFSCRHRYYLTVLVSVKKNASVRTAAVIGKINHSPPDYKPNVWKDQCPPPSWSVCFIQGHETKFQEIGNIIHSGLWYHENGGSVCLWTGSTHPSDYSASWCSTITTQIFIAEAIPRSLLLPPKYPLHSSFTIRPNPWLYSLRYWQHC
jgi:hypothetical protein